jgi:hypothetical protein
MVWWIIGLVACISGGGELPAQFPVQVQLVVHVDPLIRGPNTGCRNPDLRHCGSLRGSAFVRRTNNLVWMSERWLKTGRTVDVQLGPEMALAWAGNPAVIADLAEEVGEEIALEASELGSEHLGALLEAGLGTLGVHGHDQVMDSSGKWGDVALPESQDPCRGIEEEPLAEWVVHNQVQGVSTLAERLGADLLSFSSHVPRTIAGKMMAVSNPDGLDEEEHRVFSDRFQPVSLGSGLSSCLSDVADHPPFEAFPADARAPLLAGTGPMVVPGVRVVGSMASHFGMKRDGSLPAAHRRLIQLLVNWRYSGLMGDEGRPWTYTFHAHLFDLQGGKSDPFRAADRESNAAEGQSFRPDVEGLAALVDGLSKQVFWNGVETTGQGVTEWRTTDEFSMEGTQFSFGDVEDPLPTDTWDDFPYLPLVSKVLANSHFQCEVQVGNARVYGFRRCDSGWGWGAPGYACVNGAVPRWVGLVIPTSDGCVEIEPKGLQVAPVDGQKLEPANSCPDGLWAPREGLVVQASREATLPGRCTSG